MAKSRGRRERNWAGIGAVTVAVVVAGLAGYMLKQDPAAAINAPEAQSFTRWTPPPTVTEVALPHVAFLGDSYTGGSAMSSGPASLYPALLAAKFSFTVGDFSAGGTGYVAPGPTKPYGTRVAAVVAGHPDVVVVEGGGNDDPYPKAQVKAAARSVLTSLRSGLPKAKIVVIGPPAPKGRPTQASRRLNEDLRLLAASVGARFVDPIADGWFSGPNAKLIGTDGIHPTDAGHARMARLLEPVFAATVPKTPSRPSP